MIYIVHRDVPYEFGQVYGAWSTLEKAEASIEWHVRALASQGRDVTKSEYCVVECQLDAELFGLDQYETKDIDL